MLQNDAGRQAVTAVFLPGEAEIGAFNHVLWL